MVAVGVEEKSLIGFIMENSCAVLLQELQNIWDEIGESKADQDEVLLEIEKECQQVYQRKVDEANCTKAKLYKLVATKEAELAALMESLGEQTPYSQAEKRLSSLKEQLSAITFLLDVLEVKKEERLKQFSDIKSQIEKITAEITENGHSSTFAWEEQDLSMRKLNEFQTQLHALQKEKLERVQKVLDYTNEVHSLCGVLGLEFRKIVAEVHPSLRETSSGACTNISTRTHDGLFQTIEKLKEEKKFRTCKLRDNLRSLLELWKLMDSSEKEKHHFGKFTRILDSPYEEITEPSLLSFDIIKQIETEVERLKNLKASRMKELVLKRRLELEEVCRGAHIEPDMSTAPEKTVALIDSGLVDPTELVANIEAQIMKAREESISRKEILDRIGRWLAAREEENWLEEYSQDGNRYGAGKGAHLNLKRAEKARVTVNRIPAILDNLILKTFAWEGQKRMPFLYDGVRLISILEDNRLNRQQKEAAKRQFRERKKLHSYLEKESLYGSQPSPRRHSSFDSKATGYHMNGNRPVTQSPQKLTSGCTTPGFRRPQSYSSHQPFGHIRRLSSPHLNFINLPREDTSSSFASISGSEPEALSLG